MLTLKPESIPGTDDATKILNKIPIPIIANPMYRQFFALFGSSFRIIKNAIIPPIIPMRIGSKYHALLLGFGVYAIPYVLFAATFFCNCVISISTVSNGSST